MMNRSLQKVSLAVMSAVAAAVVASVWYAFGQSSIRVDFYGANMSGAVEFPVGSASFTMAAVSPEYVSQKAGGELGALIEDAQKANARWLPMWWLKDAFSLEYRKLNFALGLSDTPQVSKSQPLMWVNRRKDTEYAGPYNRGVGFSDPAEFILYAGLLGEGDRLRTKRGLLHRRETAILEGSLVGAVAAKLTSRLVCTTGDLRMEAVEIRYGKEWHPEYCGDPSRLDYTLTLDATDYSLLQSDYRALKVNGKEVGSWRIRYWYPERERQDSPGKYPVMVGIEERFTAPANVGGTVRDLSTLATYYLRFAVVDGLWVLSIGTDVGSSDAIPYEPGGLMTVVLEPRIARTGDSSNADWIGRLVG